MSSRLIDSLATTAAMAEVFSDRSLLQAMLDFEVALAEAESEVGIVPVSAVQAIKNAARADAFNPILFSQQTLRAGTPGIPLVRTLTEAVRQQDPHAARFVHYGATSQDVSDTALVLLLKKSRSIITADALSLETSLVRVSEEHRNTVMVGRTLLQQAPPITFGLKAAQWAAAIHRTRIQLEHVWSEALCLQLGGASGTLAALGDNGMNVGQRVADKLDLLFPSAPWHAHRDRLASLLCVCGILTSTLGKIARDLSLMMQSEVREAAEGGSEGRGGSSTMPHKQNPIGCALVLAAAGRVPGLIASFLASMLQEHERAVGGWQSEWATVEDILRATALAASSMAEVAQNLVIDPKRMRQNIEQSLGLIFAEKASFILLPTLGREEAHQLVAKACREASARGESLADVLRQLPEATAHLTDYHLRSLESPEDYLGMAEEFRRRLLAFSAPAPDGEKD